MNKGEKNMSYATDGKCHNAEPGTFGHECGKPAVWIGTKANGYQSGFCDHCKRHGYEARGFNFPNHNAPMTWKPAQLKLEF